MTRASHRLPRWQGWLVVTVGVLALVTGSIWLVLHYGVGGDAGLPHPREAGLMKMHGLAGFGALFAFGVLAGAHVPQGWRATARRRGAGQRRTGVALCTFGALLAVTAWLLYYFAPEALRPALGGLHSAVGIVMAALLLVHRRARTRGDARPIPRAQPR